MDRRKFLKLATRIPLFVSAGSLVTPFLRFLKPNVEKFGIYQPTVRDFPWGEPVVAARLSEIPEPWDFK